MLRAGGTIDDGCAIADFEVEVIGVGEGLMGQLARVRLRYEGGTGPASVVMKGPTTDAFMRTVASTMGLYVREAGFFREIAPQDPIPAARALYVSEVAEDGEFILVLEDLTGHRFGDRSEALTVDEAASVLELIGAFHGRWWRSPLLERWDWLPTVEGSLLGLTEGYRGMVGTFLERFGSAVPDGSAAVAHAIGPRLEDLL